MDSSRVIMVLGSPRSGTTWLAKIFDTHPDVLYRHEPDLVFSEDRLPMLVYPERTGEYVGIAARYVERMLRRPTVKSAGQLPAFPKSYYAPGVGALHTAMIRAGRAMDTVLFRGRLASMHLPDLFRIDRHPDLRIVMKTITAHGRAGVLLQALSDGRFILMLRHPCGQIASAMRGHRRGKFSSPPFLGDSVQTPAAMRYGLKAEMLAQMPDVTQFAWHWVTTNEMALAAIAGHENARVVVYEDLCADPIGVARDLFAFSRLSWNERTERFLRQSTDYSGPERYYGVFRKAIAAANKWRSELSSDEQSAILDVVRRSSLAKYWPDTAEAAKTAA